MRHREAGQPPIDARVDTQSGAGGPGRCGDRLVGQHDSFGLAGRPARRDDEGVTRLDRLTPRPLRALAVGGHHDAGPESSEETLGRLPRQAMIDREHRISRVPSSAELVEEHRTPGQGQGEEGRHRD